MLVTDGMRNQKSVQKGKYSTVSERETLLIVLLFRMRSAGDDIHVNND